MKTFINFNSKRNLRNRIFQFTAVIAAGLLISGCSKLEDDYKDLLEDHEIIYPGQITNVVPLGGNLRTALTWNPSPDPSVTKYVISWNNGLDSATFNASSHNPGDVVKVVVNNLKEYVYSFTIYSYDAKGNRSIPQNINNVKVYGPLYQGALFNRPYDAAAPYEIIQNTAVRLRFNTPDTINITTRVKYESTSGVTKEVLLSPDSTFITLSDFKFGTSILYRSSYVPVKGAIDTFTVSAYDTFPVVRRAILCDKSLFKAVYLPNDVGTAYGWVLPNLWDNNNGEPGFHTPDITFPISFTVDMGAAYSLISFKIWQRLSGLYNYGNPKRLEVWGSNNPNSDGSWASWTQLGTFTTVKPSGLPVGQNSGADQAMAAAGDPYGFSAPTAQMRYLRFKILESWGPGSNYFHILELSMFKTD